MERRQIEFFLAVVDHGGFTPAANALHISQPALSHAIKVLERDLGAALFDRLPRGARLTAAGEAFAESARRIAREMEIARARVDAVTGLVAGRLDLVALPGLLLDPLSTVIRLFRSRYPEVHLRIVPAETPSEIREAVHSGSAELGLTDQLRPADRDLTGEVVGRQELVAVLPAGSPPPPKDGIALADLLDREVATGPPGTIVRDLLSREAARLGRDFTPAVEVALRGSALYLSLAGAGVAVLPRPLAELGRDHDIVIAPLRPAQWRQAILLRRAAQPSPAARAMRDIMVGGPHPGRVPTPDH